MRIQIPNYQHSPEIKCDFYLEKYKVAGEGKFTITITNDPDCAGEFEDDDYIKEYCKYWFGEINELR